MFNGNLIKLKTMYANFSYWDTFDILWTYNTNSVKSKQHKYQTSKKPHVTFNIPDA